MLQHQGIWLPDGETHLPAWMDKAGEIVDGKGTYQIKKLRRAMEYVKQFRTAVDVGAHCGLWSMQLAKKFATVHAFEPVEAHRECWVKNVTDGTKGFTDSENSWLLAQLDDSYTSEVNLHACALGDKLGNVKIRSAPDSSGDSWVDGDGMIPMKRIDDYGLHHVDFIKLDCEGYELFALRGGEETLKRCKPCVIVEQKPGRAQKFGLPETGAVDYLRSLGATLRTVMAGDYILSWD